MKINYFNNLGVGVISLGFVLNHITSIPISKAFLVLPFVFHRDLLSYLGRRTTRIQSIEKIVAVKPSAFTNFNKRFYDSLCLTMNSLQFLVDQNYVRIKDGEVIKIRPFGFHEGMGNRAESIAKASKNISSLLKNDEQSLYLNLRIEL